MGLGVGEGKVAKVVPGKDVDVLTTPDIEMRVEKVVEVLFDQADEELVRTIGEVGVGTSVGVIDDEVAVAMLDTGGGLYVTQVGGLLAGKSVQHHALVFWMALTCALISSCASDEQRKECYASVVLHLCSSRSLHHGSLNFEGCEDAVMCLEKI